MNSNKNFIKHRIAKFSQMTEKDKNALMAMTNQNQVGQSDRLIISSELLDEVILTMEHARKFISNRWISMHTDGVTLYDECLEKLKSLNNEGD